MCTRNSVVKCARWRGSVVNTPMQNPDAVGQVSNNRARKGNALCEEEADVI